MNDSFFFFHRAFDYLNFFLLSFYCREHWNTVSPAIVQHYMDWRCNDFVLPKNKENIKNEKKTKKIGKLLFNRFEMAKQKQESTRNRFRFPEMQRPNVMHSIDLIFIELNCHSKNQKSKENKKKMARNMWVNCIRFVSLNNCSCVAQNIASPSFSIQQHRLRLQICLLFADNVLPPAALSWLALCNATAAYQF